MAAVSISIACRDFTANWSLACLLPASAQEVTFAESSSDRPETALACSADLIDSVDFMFWSLWPKSGKTHRLLALVLRDVASQKLPTLPSSPLCKDGRRCRLFYCDVIFKMAAAVQNSRWPPTSGFWSPDSESRSASAFSLPSRTLGRGLRFVLKLPWLVQVTLLTQLGPLLPVFGRLHILVQVGEDASSTCSRLPASSNYHF